tara:strand:+ start:2379 stop:2546 length:168 start_codon:yes stop_codon:yes gene_type:complete
MENLKTYTIALRDNTGDTFKPVSGLKLMTRQQAIKGAALARKNGFEAVCFNVAAE